MAPYSNDPAAYRVLALRAEGGRGALDAVTIIGSDGGILAEYDGDGVAALVRLARDEERAGPAMLPSNRAMILAALRDNGIDPVEV